MSSRFTRVIVLAALFLAAGVCLLLGQRRVGARLADEEAASLEMTYTPTWDPAADWKLDQADHAVMAGRLTLREKWQEAEEEWQQWDPHYECGSGQRTVEAGRQAFILYCQLHSQRY